MTIKDLWEIYINSPSEDTARARRKGKPRMPTLVSMEGDLRLRPQKAIDIWPTGKKACVRLTFADGATVECTPDHKFLIDGEWKPCGKASAGAMFRRRKRKEVRFPKKDFWRGKRRPDFTGGKFLPGEAHPNYRGGAATLVKRQKEERSDPVCDDCLESEWQDVHHNDKQGGAISPEDVAFLCKSCHRKRHAGENRRWKNGLETDEVALVSIKDIGIHETFEIEMPEHHNFLLDGGILTSNSQHAAGAVVAAEPILRHVAIDHRTNATMCDKSDAEGRLNLLKIDVLGLTQLSVIEDALEAVGMKMVDLQRVPTDDQAAFDVLNRGEFSGIFQWNGNALQSLTRQIEVDRFDDVVAISALARPGPLATGGSGEWARRRQSGVIPPGLHPLLDELTADTYGVIVYQEQVMRVVREMGGLSWEDTSLIRKAMSRRLGNEFFEQFALKFIAGAGENGVPSETARKIWDQINTFGSWAFNKSHAVAYGYISYWCCWLKAHHPFEFAAATLSHEKDTARQIELLAEMQREGYGYVPVDPERSERKWTAGAGADGRKVLIGPLQNVKGLGPVAVNQIIHARKRREPIPERYAKLLENPTTVIDSLTPIADAIRRVMPDPAARNIETRPTPIADIKPSDKAQEVMIFCTPIKINPRDENEIINLTRRGYEIKDGMTEFLQLRCADDTGTIMAKVNRFNFAKLGRPIIDKGRPGKSLWALKGKVFTMGEGFMILSVNKARYLGDAER